jgi:hypothetical protein
MLRTAVLIMGVVLMALGVGVFLSGVHGPGVQAFLGGAVLTLAVLFERWRYRNGGSSGGGKWEPTGERFVDPQSGREMEVLYDARSGERRYVPLAQRHDKPD